MSVRLQRNGAVDLKKGDAVDLKKGDRNLTKLRVGLGWDANTSGPEEFDLDASAFLLTASGSTRNAQDLVFYGALDHPSGSVQHMGDNLVGGTGAGRDDDEQILIDLTKIPEAIQEIVFTVTIYDYDVRHQNFGMVQNAYIRVIDESSQGAPEELVRYDLTEDFSLNTAVIAGRIVRNGASWKFVASSEKSSGGLRELCEKYGVKVL